MTSLATHPTEATPLALAPVARLLRHLGYTPTVLGLALRAIARTGTAQCTPWVVEADRDAVEALIPASARWADPVWDGIAVETSDAEARR